MQFSRQNGNVLTASLSEVRPTFAFGSTANMWDRSIPQISGLNLYKLYAFQSRKIANFIFSCRTTLNILFSEFVLIFTVPCHQYWPAWSFSHHLTFYIFCEALLAWLLFLRSVYMQGNSVQVPSDPAEQTLINPASSFQHNAQAHTARAANVQHLLLHPVSPHWAQKNHLSLAV